MERARRTVLMGMLAAAGMVACDDKGGDDSAGGSDVSYADVEPILAANCVSCHQSGGSAPFAFDGYDAAASRSDRIVARAVDGTGGPMPPSGLVLTDDEANILIEWDAAGAPE